MDVQFVSHRQTVINSHKLHILLKQDNLVNLLKVVDFFDIVIVSSIILDVGLVIAKGKVARSLKRFYFVLNKEAREIFKLNGWTVRLICSVK